MLLHPNALFVFPSKNNCHSESSRQELGAILKDGDADGSSLGYKDKEGAIVGAEDGATN